MDYKNISKKIEELHKQNSLINKNIIELQEKLKENYQKIKEISKNFPKCYSCGHHQDPKNMFIASEKDVENYIDQNEGYSGPRLNEYYCGC